MKLVIKCAQMYDVTSLMPTGGPNVRVSNERFSLQVFPGGNIKISNVLKISPRFRAVPTGLRYQGIGSSDTFSVCFHQSRMARTGPKKVTDEYLPATAPSAHSGFSKVGHANM